MPANLLHVGSGAPSAGILLWIAQERGFFKKHSIEVRLVAVPGTDVPNLTEEYPLGLIGAPAVLLRAAGGTDLKILGSFNTARVCGHVVARAGIGKPEDLRGKRFGVRALGAGHWIQTVLALRHLGLDSRRDDIRAVAIGEQAHIAQALESGTIDAAVLSAAYSCRLRTKGYSFLLDLYPANLHAFPDALTVTAAYLRRCPDVVEKVMAGLVESLAFSLSSIHKSTVLDAITETFKVIDVDAVEAGYQEFLLTASRKPYPSVERLRNMQEIMALHDAQLLNVRVEDLIDDRFVRKLDESGMTNS